MMIKPPHIALSALALALLLDYWFQQYRFIFGLYRYVGILIFILGLSMTFSSFYLFKKNKTPIMPGQKPTFVVMSGPYTFTRNPMYLGVATALTGVAVYIGNLLAFISPIIFFIATNFFYVPREEKLLESIFGKKYIAYKKKVRRWI
ncbi:isoprenylcysteine carboxylmethyltransferase family protein [Candidatus Woesearchaeota archaeon]|nr:isoprenylcysteine carboxylmethyltransferase family protein [Candidatus Woesearchaeota archaeon]